MQVTETLSEGLKREYKIVVTADAIEERMTTRLGELAKEVKMPGFRPGKVPVTLLRKTYGKQVLGEILEQTVNESTSQALAEREIQPALQPKIEITQFEEDADLEYTVEVEVMPEIKTSHFRLKRPPGQRPKKTCKPTQFIHNQEKWLVLKRPLVAGFKAPDDSCLD